MRLKPLPLLAMTLTVGWTLKSQTHMHKIYPKAKLIISDHSCSFHPEIFKLIKTAPVKISGGGGGGGGSTTHVI